MKTLRGLILLVLTILLAGEAGAVTLSSRKTGNWSDPFTWDAAGILVPTSVDTVNISISHTVTLDITTAVARTVNVNSGGTLSFSRSVSSQLTMSNGNITVNFQGVLDMGTEASPIPSGITATMVLASGSGATRYNLTIPNVPNSGGRFTSRGADKDPVAVATGPLPDLQGQTNLEVPAADAEGWEVGDTITIGATELTGITPNPWENQTESRVITTTATPAAGVLQVSWGAPLAFSHRVSEGVRVANLTRNVVVRSSGTNVSSGGNSAYIVVRGDAVPSFEVAQTEFFALGVDGSNESVGFDANNVSASISSCTFHDGATALFSMSDMGTRIARNVFYNNQGGIDFQNTDRAVLEGNELIFTNGMIVNGLNIRVTGNNSYSNAGIGIYLGGSRGVVEGNRSFANGDFGFVFNSFPQAHVEGNESCLNTTGGFIAYTSTGTFYTNNVARENLSTGLVIFGGSDMLLANNRTFMNQGGGIHFDANVLRPTLLSHLSYDNSTIGVELEDIYDFLIQDSMIGYDPSGAVQSNGVGFSFRSAPIRGSVRGSATDDTDQVSSSQSPGNGVLFFNHDVNQFPAAAGTVLLRGEHTIPAGRSLTLDHNQPLYHSSATAALLIRGTAHALNVTATDDASALSQAVTVEREGGQWRVEGSSSGLMGTFTGDQSGLSLGQFTMNFDENPSVQEGDRLVFGLLSSSKDAGSPKSFLMASLQNINPALTVAPGGALTLRGVAGTQAVWTRQSATATFPFVSSGSLTMENVSVSSMSAQGLQLSGSGGVVMSSVTFNFGAAGGTYVTARDLTASVTSYNMVFNDTPGRTPLNVSVQGVDSGLRWYMASFSGSRAGDTKDSDPNQKILWADGQGPQAPTGFSAAPGTAIGEVVLGWTAHWDVETDLSLSPLKGGSFRIFRSTDQAQTLAAGPTQAGVIVISTSAADGSVHAYSDTPLMLGATHYYRLWVGDELGNFSVHASSQAIPWGDLVTPTVSLSAAGGTGALGVSTSAPLGLIFNKPMDAITVYNAISLTRVKGNTGTLINAPVLVTISSNSAGDAYSVIPPPLGGNNTYELAVATTAADNFGNVLASSITLRFTTLMSRSERNVVTEGVPQGLVLDIPPGALAQDGYMAGATLPETQVAAATRKLSENSGDPLRRPLAGTVADLDVFNGFGAPQPGDFAAPVTVTIGYADTSPADGIVDNTDPPVRARSLGVYWLNETRGVWVPLASAVDTGSATVSALAPHFTTFALMAQGDLELSGAHPFPVPYTPGLGAGVCGSITGDGICFTGLPQAGAIRIYTPDGRLARELSIPAGGQLLWDVRNSDGENVATGVYLYEISNGHSSVTGKLAVIR